MCAYPSSTQEMEEGRSEVQGELHLSIKFKVNLSCLRPCLEKENLPPWHPERAFSARSRAGRAAGASYLSPPLPFVTEEKPMVRMEKEWVWEFYDPENHTRVSHPSGRLFGLCMSQQSACSERKLGPQHYTKLGMGGHAYQPST